MKKTRNPHDLVSLTAAAEITGRSRQVIPGMVARGQLEGLTIAGRLFVYRRSAERFAAEQDGPAPDGGGAAMAA
jgi:hypothetical protein